MITYYGIDSSLDKESLLEYYWLMLIFNGPSLFDGRTYSTLLEFFIIVMKLVPATNSKSSKL